MYIKSIFLSTSVEDRGGDCSKLCSFRRGDMSISRNCGSLACQSSLSSFC